MHSHTCSVELLGFAMPISINGINDKYGFPNRLEGSWSFTALPGEIRRNTQKHPIKYPKQYAEIPYQKHPKQKHLQDTRIFIIELTLNKYQSDRDYSTFEQIYQTYCLVLC